MNAKAKSEVQNRSFCDLINDYHWLAREYAQPIVKELNLDKKTFRQFFEIRHGHRLARLSVRLIKWLSARVLKMSFAPVCATLLSAQNGVHCCFQTDTAVAAANPPYF